MRRFAAGSSLAAVLLLGARPGTADTEEGADPVAPASAEEQRTEPEPEGAEGFGELRPLFARSFLLSSRTEDFLFFFGFESRTQLSLLGGGSAEPDAFPEPSLAHVRPRSVLLVMAARLYKKFGFVAIFGLPGDLVRPADNLAMQVAFVSADIVPEVATVEAGLIGVPFGRETSEYLFATRAIERSVATETMAPLGDAGILLRGAGEGWSYSTAAITGSFGRFLHPEEKPDFVFRGTLAPGWLLGGSLLQGLDLGASYQRGVQPFDPFGTALVHYTRAHRAIILAGVSRGLRWRGGADMAYERGPFGLQAEIVYERQNRDRILTPEGETGEGGTIDASPLLRHGGYVESGLFLWGSREGGFEAMAKFDYMKARAGRRDPGEAVINPMLLRNYTLGFTYFMNRSTRIQVNGIVTDLERRPFADQVSAPIFSALDNRRTWAILTQLQFWLL